MIIKKKNKTNKQRDTKLPTAVHVFPSIMGNTWEGVVVFNNNMTVGYRARKPENSVELDSSISIFCDSLNLTPEQFAERYNIPAPIPGEVYFTSDGTPVMFAPSEKLSTRQEAISQGRKIVSKHNEKLDSKPYADPEIIEYANYWEYTNYAVKKIVRDKHRRNLDNFWVSLFKK